MGLRISSNTVIAIYMLFAALCLMENNSIQSVGGLLRFLKLPRDYTEHQVAILGGGGKKWYTQKQT